MSVPQAEAKKIATALESSFSFYATVIPLSPYSTKQEPPRICFFCVTLHALPSNSRILRYPYQHIGIRIASQTQFESQSSQRKSHSTHGESQSTQQEICVSRYSRNAVFTGKVLYSTAVVMPTCWEFHFHTMAAW